MVSARTELLSQLKEMRESNSSLSSSSTGSPSAASISVEENLAEPPPRKRFRLLSGLIEKRLQQNIGKHSNVPPEEEVDRYFSATHTLAEKVDPVFFWVEHEQTYPLLSTVAFDTLVIPASSTPVERTFSTAGEATSGKRNRLSDKNLEREILFQKNKAYL